MSIAPRPPGLNCTTVNKKSNFSKLAAAGIFLSGAWLACASDVTTTSSFQRPAWLTEASVGLKESYDDNVFLSGVGTPPHYLLPAGRRAGVGGVFWWGPNLSAKLVRGLP